MSDQAVYRTAPATPGLLKRLNVNIIWGIKNQLGYSFIIQLYSNIYFSNDYIMCINQSYRVCCDFLGIISPLGFPLLS